MAIAALAVLLAGCSAQMNMATCVADEGVDPTQRARIEAAALAFVRAINAGDAAKAQGLMSAEVGPKAGPVVGPLAKRAAAAGPQAWRVDGIYYIDGVAGTTAVCVDRAEPSTLNSISVKPGARQAHIFLIDGAPLEGVFSLWLIEERGAWKVHGMSVGLSRIAKRDAGALFRTAEVQRSKGDTMLAALLFESARGLAGRGDYFSPGLRGQIEARTAEFEPPAELTNFAKPWRLGGRDYPITGVNIMAVGEGDLGLHLLLASPQWKGDGDADRRAHQFIDAFIAAHPGWDQAFDAILLQTEKPGGHHGTVYKKGSGYLPPPSPRS